VRILCVVMCVLLASTTIARAQTPAPTPAAEAKALIAEAKKLLKAKQIAEACDKLEAAEKIVESSATELAIADCREKNKQLASAYTWLLKVGAAKGGKQASRAADARWRAKKLEPKLFYLTIEVPAERRAFDLALTRDDTPIDEATWGQRVPIDAGTYTIHARAPGRVEWTQSITIDKKEQTVEVPALDELPKPPPPPPKRVANSRRSGGRTYKVTTIALTVVGLGNLGLGIGMALRARSLSADSNAICPNTAARARSQQARSLVGEDRERRIRRRWCRDRGRGGDVLRGPAAPFRGEARDHSGDRQRRGRCGHRRCVVKIALLLALAACSVPAKVAEPDLSCRDVILPTEAAGKITVNGSVTTLADDTPLDGVMLRGHAGNLNLMPVMSQPDGSFYYSYDSNKVPRVGYLDATFVGYLDTRLYPPVPVAADITVAVHMLTAADAVALAAAGGLTLDPTKGAALVEVVDCNGSPLVGGTVSTSPRGPEVRYFADGEPSTAATTTDESGRAMVVNINPASTTITGSWQGTSVRGHDVTVLANAIVLTSLQP
jgi:hypothetical protein